MDRVLRLNNLIALELTAITNGYVSVLVGIAPYFLVLGIIIPNCIYCSLMYLVVFGGCSRMVV